jgi:hypothetical protein
METNNPDLDIADASNLYTNPLNNQPKSKGKRKAITDLERQVIRRRYREHPTSQVKLVEWFESQPNGRRIGQGHISYILSDHYQHLDSDNQKPSKLGAKRHCKGEWPELESVLYEWQQQIQRKGGFLTSDILKAKATEIWHRLPQYYHIEEPKWSNGWLQGFKNRFKIKEYVRHGEAADADIDNPENIAQMEKCRKLCKEYPEEDILNMDETGLFWKQSPNRSLATEAQSGGKNNKDRITLAFTSNSTGTEKLDMLVIGRSKAPRCFKHLNLKNMRVQYYSNKSRWMTGDIMAQYLNWLNTKMRGQNRKVLLFLDNFSGHELGVEMVGGKENLSNIRIEFLPPNTTSRWQPLDQGIINAFKCRYKKQWVTYILRQLEVDQDPNKTVNLLKAIQWSRIAWEGIEPSKIQKCWWKSTLIPKPSTKAIPDPIYDINTTEIEELRQQVADLPGDHIELNEFISPDGENIPEGSTESDILNAIVDRYIGQEAGEPDLVDQDEDGIEEELERKVTSSEAIQALQVLQQYLYQQDADYTSFNRSLDSVADDIRRVGIQAKKQVGIAQFFTSK